jgi:hypothetical protein
MWMPPLRTRKTRVNGFATMLVVGAAICCGVVPRTAFAQDEARFVSGPLAWTPTFQLREAGVDSNVFNTPTDPREDTVGTASSQVKSVLSLGLVKAATQGSLDYVYFERYTQERAVNGRVSTDLELPFSRVTPDIAVSWTRVKDRSGNEVDIRAPRNELSYTLGLKTDLTPRMALKVSGGRQTVTYDKGFAFRGVDIATQLDRETLMGTVGATFALTPFTSLLMDASVSRDDFPLRPGDRTDNIRANVGLDFAPDAVIHGRALIGYHSLRPTQGAGSSAAIPPFGGMTSSTEIGYTLLGLTRFSGRFARESNYSILTSEPLYVSTGGGLDIVQRLFGPLDLILNGTRDRLAYVDTPAVAAPGHTDIARTLGGGVSIRVGEDMVVSVLYDNTTRRSSAGREFAYDRERIYTTVTYGF